MSWEYVPALREEKPVQIQKFLVEGPDSSWSLQNQRLYPLWESSFWYSLRPQFTNLDISLSLNLRRKDCRSECASMTGEDDDEPLPTSTTGEGEGESSLTSTTGGAPTAEQVSCSQRKKENNLQPPPPECAPHSLRGERMEHSQPPPPLKEQWALGLAPYLPPEVSHLQLSHLLS
ncbi:hypothetical protein Adt_35545 [Abeliophyllum distichum]|uniref:Uncharacterized protein n=1 Tax=Abeliophyllum distichum TaxID=126358 RepID=A0ABD1QFX2_9LAMI